MMEDFASDGSRTPLKKCLGCVSECDVLIVIVAHRYGWWPIDQPHSETKSVTWLECERAFRDGKEILAFVVDDRADWPEEYREEYRVVLEIRKGSATPELLDQVQSNVARLALSMARLNYARAKVRAWL